jgi:hypothetical protein
MIFLTVNEHEFDSSRLLAVPGYVVTALAVLVMGAAVRVSP